MAYDPFRAGSRLLAERARDRLRAVCPHPAAAWYDDTTWDRRPRVVCGHCHHEIAAGTTVLEIRQRAWSSWRSD